MLAMTPEVVQELPSTVKKWLVAQAVNVVTRTPIGTGALILTGINRHFHDHYGVSKQWYGVHIDTDHPYWSQRLGAPLAASPTRTTPVNSGGRRESRKSRRASSAPRPDRSRRGGNCPKGHYWSYKHKKCVKSKF